MKKTVPEYLKSLTNKELRALIGSELYDDLKMPDLKSKIDKELQHRKEVTKAWEDR